MNQVYKVIFCKATGVFVAVAEYAKSHGKKGQNTVGGQRKPSLGGQATFICKTLILSMMAVNGVAVAATDVGTSGNIIMNSIGGVANTITSIGVSGTSNNMIVGNGNTVNASNGIENTIFGSRNKIGAAGNTTALSQIAILGNDVEVNGTQSVGIGSNVTINGPAAVAIGGDDLDEASKLNTNGTVGGAAVNSGNIATKYQSYTGKPMVDNSSNSKQYPRTTSGTAAVALGVQAQATGALSTAVGTSSRATGLAATAFGVGADASADNSVALGSGSKVDLTALPTTQITQATVKGVTYSGFSGANATAGDQVSIGAGGYERQLKNVAPGAITASSTDAINGSQLFAIAAANAGYAHVNDGTNTGTGTGDATTNAGGYNQSAGATGNGAISVGVNTTAAGANAVSVGTSAKAASDSSVAIGLNAKTNTAYAQAVGANANATGQGALALGGGASTNPTTANGAGAIAIGGYGDNTAVGAKTNSAYGVAIGSGSTTATTATNGIAIGKLANVTTANSVALGSSALTTAGSAINTNNLTSAGAAGTTTTAGDTGIVANARIGGITYGGFAGATANGVVSVGAAGSERRIQNVAAGEISATSTDAINGSQLYSVVNAPLTILGNVNKDTGTNGTQQSLGSTVKIIGSTTAIALAADASSAATTGAYSAKNVQTVVTDGQVQVQLADNPEFTSIKAGPVTINSSGINAGNTTISNVAAGNIAAASTDAVNGGQLYTTNQNVAANTTNIAKGINYKGNNGTAINQPLGGTLNIVGANAGTATDAGANLFVNTQTNQLRVELAKDLTGLNSATYTDAAGNKTVTSGNGVAITPVTGNTVTLTTTGLNNGGNTITNVASGGNVVSNAANIGDVQTAAAAARTEVVKGTNISTVTKATGSNGQDIYTINANGTTASAGSSAISVTAGAKDANNVTNYQVDLSQASKDSLAKADSALQTLTTSVNGSSVETLNKTNSDIGFVNGTGTTARANGTDITFDINKSTLTADSTGKVTAGNTGDSFATAGDVANAINNSGFTLTAQGNNGSLVKPGATVDMKNTDGNLVISKSATDNTVNYNLAPVVKVGTTSPISIDGTTGTIGGLSNTSFDSAATYTGGKAATQEQLSAANTQLNNTLTAKGMDYMGDSGTKVHRDLGSQVNVKGGATGTLTTGNIGIVADGNDTLNVQLAKDINLGNDGSLTAGNTKVDNTGVTISGGANPVTLTNGGLNNGGNTITNVATGVNANDAVNVSQLQTAQAAATSKVDGSQGVSVNTTNNLDGSKTYTVAAKTDGSTIKVDGSGNLSAVTSGITTAAGVSTATTPAALATAGDVANAINNSGFTLTAQGNNGSLVKPGATVDMKNTDGNLVISKSATDNTVNYNLAPVVKVGTTSPISIDGTTGTIGGLSNTSFDSAATYTGGKAATQEQLSAANTQLNNTLTAKGMDYMGDSGTKVHRDLGSQVNVKGGATGTLTTGNIGIVADGNDTLNVQLAKDINLGNDGSLTAGNTKVDNTGVTISGGANPVTLTNGGLNNGGNTITNVASGGNVLSNAANIGDVKAARTTLTSGDNSISVINNGTAENFAYDIRVNNQGIVENAQLPVIYTNANGDKLYKQADGSFNTKPDGTGSKVEPANVIASMQNASGSTTAPTTLSNVAGNLPSTYNQDSYNAANNPVSKSQSLPQAINTSNAATVGDVLNSGFNLQGNGAASDFVKAYDTLNFKNGVATTANVVTAADGKVSDISFDVNTDGTTITTKTITGADGKPVTQLLANTTPLTTSVVGKTNVPVAADANKLVSAGDVANAINNAGFTIKANGDAGELVKAGGSINLTQGDNITISRSGTDFVVATAKDVKFDSVTTGNTVMNNGGITITHTDPTKNVSLTGAGLSNGGNQITNVASGGDVLTNAANIGDIKRIQAANDKTSSVTSSGALSVSATTTGNNTNYNVDLSQTTKDDIAKGVAAKDIVDTKGLTFTADSGTTDVKKLGSSVAVTGDNNITTKADTNGVQVALNKNITIDSAAIGGKVAINTNGIHAGNTVVSGVASGLQGKTIDQVKNEGSASPQWNNAASIGDLTQVSNSVTNVNNIIGDVKQLDGSYNVAGQGAQGGLSVIQTLNNINNTGIKYAHTNGTDEKGTIGSTNDSSAGGIKSTAIGVNAIVAAGANSALALGHGAKVDASGKNAVALGASAHAAGDSATALGTNTQAGANNVALGAGSQATQTAAQLQGKFAYTPSYTNLSDIQGVKPIGEVAVGASPTDSRRITNLAAGAAPTDAVNVSQLAALDTKVNNTINQLGYKLGDVEDNANAGTSAAMATAALPQAYLPGKSMIAGGMGTYNGQSAAAIGISKLSDNGRWVIKVNGTADSQGNFGGAVGAGFHW